MWIKRFSSKIEPLIDYKPRALQRRKLNYLDLKVVKLKAGNGGSGGCTFMHLFANANAGPGGGNGGNGGHIIFNASHTVQSLGHIESFYRAPKGEKGGVNKCDGKNAENLIIKVPLGTIIIKEPSKSHFSQLYQKSNVVENTPSNENESRAGLMIAELEAEGDMFMAARGGAGGKGNAYFADALNQAPMVYEKGGLGEELSYILELRTIAHFGLIGYPNAGKSTLLRAVSRANPKIAPYPFTTLQPQLGILKYSDGVQLRMADLPGLIKGSHLNEGLGYRFLRHAQRCILLVYLLDFSTPLDPKPASELQLSQEITDESVYNASIPDPPWIQFESLKAEIDTYFADPENRIISPNNVSQNSRQTQTHAFCKNGAEENPNESCSQKPALQLFFEQCLNNNNNNITTKNNNNNNDHNNTASHNNQEFIKNLQLTLHETTDAKYKYYVLGTKFDVGEVCCENLKIFAKKYPDVKVFPCAAKTGLNIPEIMIELRKIYDFYESNK